MTLQDKRDAFVDALARWETNGEWRESEGPLLRAAEALVEALDAPSVTMSMKSMMPPPPAPSEPSPARPLELHLGGEIMPLEYATRGTSAKLRELERSHEEMAERVRRAVEWIRAHYMTEPCGCGAPPTSKIVTTLLPILEGGRDKEATEK